MYIYGYSICVYAFEKCCDFYPNSFKFCAVEKNYTHVYIRMYVFAQIRLILLSPSGK